MPPGLCVRESCTAAVTGKVTVPAYSHSRLSLYETCPRQYRYHYLDRIEPPDEAEAIELFVGSRVHQALEALYRELMRGRRLTLEELIATFRHHWEQEWPKSMRFPRPDDEPASYRALGERCLADYYARYEPFDGDHTIAVERLLVFPLDPEGEVQVQGYVDRLSVGADGVWRIHDYKTGKYLPTQQQADADRQLALYEIGVRHAWPDVREVELVWHYLAHDVELRSRRSTDDLAQDHCGWCPYRAICPAWSHLVATEQLTPQRFAGDAGVQLVDRYAGLKAEQRRIDAELETAHGDLVRFAEQESLERVRGTEHVVTAKRASALRFPSKDDEARGELERFVKDHGRWDEVSELSLRALAKTLELARWPQALVDGVRSFAARVNVVRVRLARLKPEDE
ncbi:MAG: hypothetical protein DMD90_08420 [Candidatus Rokuibacteriota bacterium]|nr:MAG: hypothetical protein DMD90_08420 [Candidatus Rokubacteria bacterium]